MAQLSGNTCEIITLLPLGVVCNTVNASTPTTTNGSIYLDITGGTAPYTVTWSNGGQGQSLINLQYGDYTATVVDYYGDYSATTTCSVGYDSFNLDKFEDCSNSGTYLYYKSQEPSIFTSGKVYQLSNKPGCWISSGTTLWTNQTYVNSFAVINGGPFNDCVSCLPTPTPTPVYPQYICLSKNSSPYTQYTFESGSTVYNGYPVWSETGSTGFKMIYNVNSSVWQMSGWTGGGILQTPTSAGPPPTGTWLVLGSSETWTAVSGNCASTPITIAIQKSNPTCTDDGQLVITAGGGTPGYTYSLDGSFYQNSSTFNGLSAGSGTVFVKDSLGNVQTQTYTLTNQTPSRTYGLSAGISTSETTLIDSYNQKVVKQTYGVDLGSSLSYSLPVYPDIVSFRVGISYGINLFGTNNGSINVPTFTTGVTVTATGGYSVTSTTEYYDNVTSIVTIGAQTQPKSAITYNKTYYVTYNPQNYITGEKLTFEITNGGQVYTGGNGDLPQRVSSKLNRIQGTNIKLENINPCSTVSSGLSIIQNKLNINISESNLL